MLKTPQSKQYFSLNELTSKLQSFKDPRQGTLQTMVNLYSVIWKIQSKQPIKLRDHYNYILDELYKVVVQFIKSEESQQKEFHLADIIGFQDFTDLIIIISVTITKKKKTKPKAFLNSRFQFMKGSYLLTPQQQLQVANPIVQQVRDLFFLIMKQTIPQKQIQLQLKPAYFEQISYEIQCNSYESLETIEIPNIQATYDIIEKCIEETICVEIVEKIIYVNVSQTVDNFVFSTIQYFTHTLNKKLLETHDIEQPLDFTQIVKKFLTHSKKHIQVKDSLLYCRNFVYHQSVGNIEDKHFKQFINYLILLLSQIQLQVDLEFDDIMDYLCDQKMINRQLLQ